MRLILDESGAGFADCQAIVDGFREQIAKLDKPRRQILVHLDPDETEATALAVPIPTLAPAVVVATTAIFDVGIMQAGDSSLRTTTAKGTGRADAREGAAHIGRNYALSRSLCPIPDKIPETSLG
jgi:hypothetical protein